jgi:DNA-binding transcriptional LysR family regulator
VVRTPPDERRFVSAVVGQERRHCALAADDPWARRRTIRLGDIRQRTVALDRRTGSTTTDLWPPGTAPAVEYTQDIDDWLAVIATGRCVGITPESTVTQYRRQGIVFRPVRDATPVPVWFIWRRQDPHPATHAAVALASDLYRSGRQDP